MPPDALMVATVIFPKVLPPATVRTSPTLYPAPAFAMTQPVIVLTPDAVVNVAPAPAGSPVAENIDPLMIPDASRAKVFAETET